jgi:threonine dehydrogenase-like Zn-dependent dehydrogenase
MRATVLYKSGRVRFEERLDPTILTPTDAVIRLQAIGATRPGGHVSYVGVPHGVSLDGQKLWPGLTEVTALPTYYRDFGYSSGLVKLGHIASGIEKLARARGDVVVRFELAEEAP